MSDSFSRRDLVVLAGAGAALAACTRTTQERETSIPYLDQTLALEYSGRCARHGGLPKDPPSYPNGATAPDFRPEFITVVHIDFDRPWRVSVNHACYRLLGASPSQRLQRALELFRLKRPETSPKLRFSALPEPHKPRLRHGALDFDDFDWFGFGSQNEIFFYFDNPDIAFDDEWLISFAPVSDTGRPRALNYSFFNAKSQPVQLHSPGVNTGWLVTVENYYTNHLGRPVTLDDPTAELLYAMNLHFKMKTDTGYIPLVIDPETGNGAGHEP